MKILMMIAVLASTLLATGCDDGESDSNGDSNGDTDTDTDTDADTGTESDSQCVGLDDFTLCDVVTSPDRSFDICVDEVCVSPGCGDTSCNTPGPHFPIPDTSQRLCYGNDVEMTCTSFPCDAAGTPDFCGQDAQYGWDTTHDASERFARDTSMTDHPVVTDEVTGLVWQGCAGGLSGDSCGAGSEATYTWTDALVYCDELSWAGHDDWRLPDEHELISIIDSDMNFPSIDDTAFPATPANNFWSSSSCAYNGSNAWFVTFYYGYMYDIDKTSGGHARCVRSGPMQARRFEPSSISGDLVVEDTLTGLVWQGCPRGLSGDGCEIGAVVGDDWSGSLSYCEGLDWGGETDWRLPNKNELMSIVSHRVNDPAIDDAAFPGTPASHYFWSSSYYANNTSHAWGLDFYFGKVNFLGKTTEYYSRCVRN